MNLLLLHWQYSPQNPSSKPPMSGMENSLSSCWPEKCLKTMRVITTALGGLLETLLLKIPHTSAQNLEESSRNWPGSSVLSEDAKISSYQKELSNLSREESNQLSCPAMMPTNHNSDQKSKNGTYSMG